MNVALNKPAYQQNPFKQNDSTGDASNAVDGQKSDLTRNGGQCVVSAGKETATWWVNLTSIHSIHHITIYFMTDNRAWGMSLKKKEIGCFDIFLIMSKNVLYTNYFDSIVNYQKIKENLNF